jgi:hypothetical protein
MAGGKNSNNMNRSLLKTFKAYAKGLIQRCPYNGMYEMTTVSKAVGTFSIIPKGSYQLNYRVSTDDVNMIFLTQVEVTD